MKLSVSTWNYLRVYGQDADTSAAVNEIVNGGFGVELWLGLGPGLDIGAEEKKSFKTKLRGVTASAHSILGEEHNSNYISFARQIDLCASLGAPLLVVHLDTMCLGSGEVDFCKKVVDYATQRGVTVALENGELELLSLAVDAAKDLRICIDTGHANIEGKRTGRADMLPRYLERFRDRIVHFHIHDNHGESDEHLIPGKGTVDWKGFYGGLPQLRLPVTYVLELRSEDSPLQDANAGRAFLRSLAARG